MPPVKFRGKVDWWFYAVMIGSAALLCPILYVSLFVSFDGVAAFILLLVFLLLEGFCLSILCRNSVSLREDALWIVFGLQKKKIPYGEILSLSETRSPEATLAASLDRIKIQRKNRSYVIVSVKEKDKFFAEMRRRAPEISIPGQS